jgi:hypothetical protein
MSGDLYALSRELTGPNGAPVNDRIPGMKGRTMLHVVARMYALRAGGWCAADREAADVLNQMTAALLAAGADPCARDREHEMASAYTDGRTPPALVRRMEREADEGRFEETAMGKPKFRFTTDHLQSKNGLLSRARAHARATGQVSMAVGCIARLSIHREKKGSNS